MTKRCLPLLLLCLLALPAAGFSMPCHCFNDKEFDPGQPLAADPYFLATTQNSLFSIVFGLQKKEVIFAKQKPRATAESLWIAYWLADRSDLKPKEVLRARYRADSWPTVLEALALDKKALGETFRSVLEAGGSDGELSTVVVNEILASRKLATEEELENLRALGAGDQETILAALLGLQTGRPATEFYQAVTEGKSSWGTLLLKAGLDGTEMVGEVRRLLANQGN